MRRDEFHKALNILRMGRRLDAMGILAPFRMSVANERKTKVKFFILIKGMYEETQSPDSFK